MCVNVDDFQYTVSTEHIVIDRYIGENPNPVVPAMIDGLPVKELGKYSFAGTDIVCITIPEGVESIEENAFGVCESLTDVTLPSSLKRLGSAVFQGCELLKTIKISGSSQNYSVVDGILYDTQQKALVLCPPGLNCERIQVMPRTKIISNAAFFQNRSLKQVELPLSLVRIEANAFLFTDDLSFVSIPPSVTSIDESAFIIGPLVLLGKQFKLYCFKVSYGYQYATKQGIPVETLYAYVTDSVSAEKEESQDRECTEQITDKTIVKPEKKSFWKKIFG